MTVKTIEDRIDEWLDASYKAKVPREGSLAGLLREAAEELRKCREQRRAYFDQAMREMKRADDAESELARLRSECHRVEVMRSAWEKTYSQGADHLSAGPISPGCEHGKRANLLEHAPEDIAYLLSRVEESCCSFPDRQRTPTDWCPLHRYLNQVVVRNDELNARIAALETEVAVLAEERGEAHSLWAKDKARLEAEVARLREGLRSALHEFAGQRHITGSRVRNVLDSLLSGSGEGAYSVCQRCGDDVSVVDGSHLRGPCEP